VLANIRSAWQWLNYTWDTHVLSFDADAQQAFVKDIGIPGATPISLLLWSAIIAVTVLGAIAGAMHVRARPRPNAVKLLYARFCRKAARFGATRTPCEGPLDFASRAAQSLPGESERIRRISTHYVNLRYSPNFDPSALQQFAREVELFGSKN